MFKKSESADAGDYKHATPEIAYSESSPAKYPSTEKKNQPAMIGASIRVKGELSGDEDMVIQGHVEGTIELKQNNLTVGAQGSVKANSRAKIIVVEGKVEGDLYGEERVVIKHSGDVRGNIVAPRVSLEDGAKFKGSIDMEPRAGTASVNADKRGAQKSFEQTNSVNAPRGAKDPSPMAGAQIKTA